MARLRTCLDVCVFLLSSYTISTQASADKNVTYDGVHVTYMNTKGLNSVPSGSPTDQHAYPSQTKISVNVLDAKILNPLKPVDPDEKVIFWPIVYLKLDIGIICLETDPYWEQGLYTRVIGGNGECSLLYCEAPGGPVQSWGHARLTESLSNCILQAVTAGHFEIENKDGQITLKQDDRIAILWDRKPDELSEFYSVNVNDPNDHLRFLLTPKFVHDIDLVADENVFEEGLRVSTNAFFQGEVAVCLYNPEIRKEDLPPSDPMEYGCKVRCFGFIPEDPTNQAELRESFWNCLSKFLATWIKQDFQFYKCEFTGKIKISTYENEVFVNQDGESYISPVKKHIEL